jgi:hypothetical protein
MRCKICLRTFDTIAEYIKHIGDFATDADYAAHVNERESVVPKPVSSATPGTTTEEDVKAWSA